MSFNLLLAIAGLSIVFILITVLIEKLIKETTLLSTGTIIDANSVLVDE